MEEVISKTLTVFMEHSWMICRILNLNVCDNVQLLYWTKKKKQ